MTRWQAAVKRGFDVVLSTVGLFLVGWLIFIGYIAASLDTGRSGFFVQNRVGRYGRSFQVIKLRTMRDDAHVDTTITIATDPRITRLGGFLRRYKVDELPQLINVFVGDMSFVGPRPDVNGFADMLEGDDRIILSVRPGITGPASLKYRDEENILASCDNPEKYSRDVIFPHKVQINREYIRNYSMWRDVYYILMTIKHI